MTDPTRILLVEDSKAQAEYSRLLLESAGYEVATAADTAEADRHLASGRFDAVLTDLTLPGENGFDFCRRLKADPHRKQLPVIILSASGDPADIERGREAGADGYASKEGEIEEILQQLQQAIDPRSVVPPRESDAAAGQARPAALDWSAVSQSVSGDQELLKRMAAAILEEAPQLLQQLDEAIRSRDPAIVKSAAHTLKGSVRILHLTDVMEIGDRLERAGRSGQLDDARAMFEDLQGQLHPALRELADFASDVKESGAEDFNGR